MKNTSFTGDNQGATFGNKGYKSNISPTQQQNITIINKRNNFFNHIPSIVRIIAKAKAYFMVRGIKSALKEVDLIEKGAKNPKSLDQLLNEL